MTVRQILTAPATVLNSKCSTVDDFDNDIATLADDMIETVLASGGVGLAAPQIDCLKKIVVVAPFGTRDFVFVLINPIITWKSAEIVLDNEACLSLPGVNVPVYRHSVIEVQYQDVNGQTRYSCFTDWSARVVQHEIDHLDGILITDRHAGVNTEKSCNIEGSDHCSREAI